jgi:hypothetical protein
LHHHASSSMWPNIILQQANGILRFFPRVTNDCSQWVLENTLVVHSLSMDEQFLRCLSLLPNFTLSRHLQFNSHRHSKESGNNLNLNIPRILVKYLRLELLMVKAVVTAKNNLSVSKCL